MINLLFSKRILETYLPVIRRYVSSTPKVYLLKVQLADLPSLILLHSLIQSRDPEDAPNSNLSHVSDPRDLLIMRLAELEPKPWIKRQRRCS